MDVILAFERDPYVTELDTTVVAAGDHDGRTWVELADTILYPEGGGQPADHGFINGTEVLGVARAGGRVRHFLAGAVEPGPVHVTLDWELRYDHMQQHTAQHLVTAVAQDRFGWATTAFHLGAAVSDVELGVPAITHDALRELEDAVAVEVRASRSVTARRVTRDEYAALAVRSRGLPDGHTGSIRLVEIAGVDCNTCGGTHVRSTAELEAVALLATEPMRGGTRVTFAAGGRLRRHVAASVTRTAELRALLGAPDDELVAVAGAKLEQLRGALAQHRALEGELVAALAHGLAERPGAVVHERLGDHDGGFLQRLARQVVERAPDKVVLLTAGSDEGFFALAAGSDAPCTTAELGPRVAELLEGRGGGPPGLFQGRASRLTRHDDAVELVLRSTRGEPLQ